MSGLNATLGSDGWTVELPGTAIQAPINTAGYLAGEARGIRPRLLVFGNSIAAQSATAFDGVNNAGASDQRASTATFTAASAQTISSGAKIAFRNYTGEVETTTVSGTVTASTSIPLTTPLRKMVRASGNGTFTVYTTDQPSNIRQNIGPISGAIALLGYPVEIINPSYGYGGATIQQIVTDLPNFLRRCRPHYVALHLMENNMTTGESWESVIKPWLHRAVEECLRFGATPIVYSAVPATTVNDAAKSAVWDAQADYINGGALQAAYPQCRTVDLSSPWLDTTATTSRLPVAGVATDGLHPDGHRRFYVGAFTLDTLRAILPEYNGNRAGAALNANSTLSGTGGSTSGSGTVTNNGIAASYTLTPAAGVAVTASKTADGYQNLVMSIAGASNITTTDMFLTNTAYTVPANFGPNTAVRGWVKFRINSQANMALIYPQLTFSGGEVHSSGQNETNMATDTALIGQIVTMDMAAVPVPGGATTAQLAIRFRPQTIGSPSGVTLDIDVIEMGIEPAAMY